MKANRVCVIGAGTMGSGIAAHLANIGFEVTLLDLTKQSIEEAFSRSKQVKPPHFMTTERAQSIRLGSLADNLDWITEADWVCEAIIERPDAKAELFKTIAPLISERAMISTNTSGLEISMLGEHFPEEIRRKFLGTHFFNPPRYLKLLELIPTTYSDPKAVEAMTKFLEQRVARRVVVAKDTPGFIANRYGMWSMFQAIHVAEKLRIPIEQVDFITGPFLGRPRSGSFRLNDLVGLDIMQDIATNLIQRRPGDPFIEGLKTPKSMAFLAERGWIGEKTGQGYYRREGKELLAFDLETNAYRLRRDGGFESLKALEKLPLGERIGKALELKDEAGEFLRHYLLPIMKYADYLKEEISHSVRDFDRVMMWGFGWEAGPFAMMDAIGHEKLGMGGKAFYSEGKILDFSGKYVKPEPEPEFATIKDFPILSTHENFLIRDLGDGIKAVSLTTKMGVITPALVTELTKLLKDPLFDRFMLTSEARSFSAGFDLKFFLERIEKHDVEGIEQALIDLQKLGEMLEQRKVVAAVFGHCLGAGLELAFSCSMIAAHPETTIGFPETRVGLIPGGRGTTLARVYNQASAKRLTDVCLTLAEGTTGNPDQARTMGILRSRDVTVYHPDRLIYDAKKLLKVVMPAVRPAWKPSEGPLQGMIDRELKAKLADDTLTEYDLVLGEKLKSVFARCITYEEALAKERSEFLDLCWRAHTQGRIKAMVENGKPLRN
ncbi:MAG: enoyl-CoA hydratase/isomerase family protein [Armatimonadetes bacterium]|nr:enoyl-CoA hydratase/isomerase family protein [Armatimonadota bacterium]